MPITTFGIGAAVTPTVVKTAIVHYTNRKQRAQKPTAHISYDEGLHLIRSFLLYASHHTVEELQAFTSQWVPNPKWVRLENVLIPESSISRAANLLITELGEAGTQQIGGQKWWQWRKKNTPLKAEWIEMRSDYNLRQKEKGKCRRVMLYVHGGAYFFGSVDEHRYQLQRHARKLKARVFAPRYRLAPQFPFPCGLLDCLAAYLYLLSIHEPSEIVFAGDSAGGGMVLSILCLLRDQRVPLPAGAILISPWVDLTHSFPSLSRDDGYDYIPPYGFMQKPSKSWPPPNEDETEEILRAAGALKEHVSTTDDSSGNIRTPFGPNHNTNNSQPPLSFQLDGKEVVVKDQIQLYATNQLITHPLVSPVLQPSLGGLPPLLVMVGGGELLRDEQIYAAHRAADPQKYKLNDKWRNLYDPEDAILKRYKSTPVQLQVWDDLCHVAPTLSFTRPAKFMYRSVAQFGAWVLSRAQKCGIEITDDADSSTESDSSESEYNDPKRDALSNTKRVPNGVRTHVGQAGDPIPPFHNSMIRQQVDRHGNTYTLAPASALPATTMSPDLVGVVKEGPTRKWLAAKQQWDVKYQSNRRKVHKERIESYKTGRHRFFGEGENPPPSALAGRQHDEDTKTPTKFKKSWGLGMWSSWSWKHDEKTILKDEEFTKKEEEKKEGQESSKKSVNEKAKPMLIIVDAESSPSRDRSMSRTRSARSPRRKSFVVHDEGQIEGDTGSGQGSYEANMRAPAIAVEPAMQIDGQAPIPDTEHLTPMFLPRWRTPAHLRDNSRDASDAGSMYSRWTAPDNASMMAVFSAPGVTSETTEHISRDKSEQQATTTPSIDERALDSRPGTAMTQHDAFGGYDTPVSRRSVERLQSHQVNMHGDDASIHSSAPIPVTRDMMQHVRNRSTMAVVQAAGIIAPIDDAAEVDGTDDLKEPLSIYAAVTQPTTEIQHSNDRNVLTTQSEQNNLKTRETTATRPGLYNRDDSGFVTAMEKL